MKSMIVCNMADSWRISLVAFLNVKQNNAFSIGGCIDFLVEARKLLRWL